MPETPNFLYTPPLYRESPATLSWEDTPGAEGYELEAAYNETLDHASHGKNWGNIDNAHWSWEDQQEPNGTRWSDLPTLPAQGLMWRNVEFIDKPWGQWDADREATWAWMQEHSPAFTIYSGPGEDIPAPDQGVTWADIAGSSWNWAAQEGPDARTWKELTLLPSLGLEWRQHDSDRRTWAELEEAYDSWTAFERQAARGLTWGSLDARRLDWDEVESIGAQAKGRSWREWEHLPPDDRTQKGFTDSIPRYTKAVQYRVRARDATGSSAWLTTGLIKVLPRKATLSVEQGGTYYVAVNAEHMPSFDATNTVQYDPKTLLLLDFAAQTAEGNTLPGILTGIGPQPSLELLSHKGGQVRFKLVRTPCAGANLTGALTLLEFKALATGSTEVILRNE